MKEAGVPLISEVVRGLLGSPSRLHVVSAAHPVASEGAAGVSTEALAAHDVGKNAAGSAETMVGWVRRHQAAKEVLV